jgi:hypothetical protein
MSKLSAALGANYESKREDLRIKKFELGGHTFKVRIPLVAESDKIYQRIIDPPAEKIDAIYQQLAKPLQEMSDPEIEIKDNDIFVDGKSIREIAKTKVQVETRVVEYIKLLVPEQGSMEDITFADIEAEWPTSVQLAMVEKIGELIAPTYKETRGN